MIQKEGSDSGGSELEGQVILGGMKGQVIQKEGSNSGGGELQGQVVPESGIPV